jgi:acetylornithine deacetylase/succinyl-diaminopimelate desuccinylase-like protein
MISAEAVARARSSHRRFLLDLCEFLRFPSVSARPECKSDVLRCAQWLAQHLRRIGLDDVVVIPTPGHPIVYAQWLRKLNRPTILIYGHYDVQPADENRGWASAPFTPTIIHNSIVARGASDDKGQLMTHVKAMQSYFESARELPVNVKCLFEGEEEIGSTHLPFFLQRNCTALAADIALMSDTQMLARRPAIVCSLRGLLNLELEVAGPSQEVHSGLFGGAIENPVHTLCALIGRLHTADGKIAIPGFYDEVRSVGLQERRSMAQHGPTNGEIQRDAGIRSQWGERGYSLYERTTIRPSLDVSGIAGGYAGSGVKGIIPDRARAKISFRLVPEQDPDEIERLFRSHLARIAPTEARIKLHTHSKARPVAIDRKHPALQAAFLAYKGAFGACPVLTRSGGSIPVVGWIKDQLGIPTILMGFAAPDDRRHGPGEKLNLDNYYRGIETSIRFMGLLSGVKDESLRRGRFSPARASA